MIDPNANNYTNDANVEFAWAAQAMRHAEVYEKLLLTSHAPLTLTKLDDDIYSHFRDEFPKFDISSIDYEEMKTFASKDKWRAFCNHYEGKVKDFNMGTLIRAKAMEPFGEENSFLGVRMQFFAIEIARTKEGLNEKFREKMKTSSS